ncbi:bifunctional 3-(3-hydroxy-phenyl)propionate/3-hydroxycinnamic acid hydroxylase [Sphingobium sp.]|uniref:bifunctional 3-(3-hydroxy-phenyl)propionate/3-hydroxycinnamic acid hydroxylase MhpA n=1 Tax=Sphingobium sp. TaxID=1912891 RepID=UPI003BB57D3D
MNKTAFDVAIIGYGPTGLVLASALGQLGHSVVVIERWPTLYGMPRLSHIDDETARIIQATSDVDHALRGSEAIPHFTFVNAEGLMLTQAGEGTKQGKCGFPADISIYQPDIEEAIDARVQGLPSVTRMMGCELNGFSQTAGDVQLTVTPKDSAVTQEISARFVVGCDGARSTVRELLNIGRSDEGFNERWLNIDTRILRPIDAAFRKTIQYCDPARGHMHLPIGTERLRFELAVLKHEDADAFLRPEFAWQWLRTQHDLGPDDVQIIRQIVYQFGAQMADRWRSDRILIAGDAAHTMPPYMGQGACSGMRDGYNLAWKLDLILRGVSHPDLLDSYETERRPHVAAITQMSLGLGRIANEHDAEKARQRDAYMRANPPRKPVIPGMVAGIVDLDRSPMAGEIFPQGRVRLGEMEDRFDTVMGNGFVLLSRTDHSTAFGPDRLALLRRIGVKFVALDMPAFVDIDGVYGDLLGEGRAAVLARPDFTLFGTANGPDDVPALVDRLLARLHVQEQASADAEARHGQLTG